MRKKFLWYVSLGLLCCGLTAYVVNAAGANQQVTKKQLPNTSAQAPAVTKVASPANKAADVAPLSAKFANGSKLSAAPAHPLQLPAGVSTSSRAPEASGAVHDRLGAERAYEQWKRTGTATPADKRLMMREIFNTHRARNNHALDNQGGPDGSGYAFVDNVTPDTASFNWIELCGDPNATDGPIGDDNDVNIPVGFTFPFYGTNYTTCDISTNGLMSFGGANFSFSASDPASTLPVFRYVAPFWFDGNTAGGGLAGGCNQDANGPWIRYESFGTYLVVEWKKMPQYSEPDYATFEAILYANGNVKVQFGSDFVMPAVPGLLGNVAVGVDGPGASDGLSYWYWPNGGPGVGNTPAASTAIWFTPPSPNSPGRCCYGDPLNPSCAENTLADCQALAGNFLVGGNCVSNPCVAQSAGETCASAIPITSLPYSITGQTTCGFNDDYEGTCLAPYDTGPDVLYTFTLAAPTSIEIIVNASEAGGDPFAGVLLSDHCPPDANCIAAGETVANGIIDLPVSSLPAGTYYIMVDNWPDPPCINYDLTVQTLVPCTPSCPPGALQENEPNCADEYVDVTDGGCNSTPNVSIPITCGQTVCGTTGTYLFTGLQYRDTDWYELTLTSPMNVTWSTQGDYAQQVFILNSDCNNLIVYASAVAVRCSTATCTAPGLNPGTYYLFAGPSVFTGVPCGTQYVGTVTCTPYVPPIGRCCYGEDPNAPLCTDNTEFECTALNGNWNGATTCAATPCPPCYDFSVTAPYDSPIQNTCGAGNDCNLNPNSEEQVYQVHIPHNGSWSFSLCDVNSTMDSYIFLTDQCCGGTIINQDDDSQCGLQSEILCQPLNAGVYYLEVEGFSSDCGQYVLHISECLPCTPDCPPGALQENEPNCADEYVDVTDGGCNSTPPVFIPITCGQTVCGTTGTYLFTGLQYRDTDWYELTLTSPMNVTWSTQGDYAQQVFILTGVCPTAVITSAAAARCNTCSCTANGLAAGTYYLFAGPSVFTGVPCGTAYVGTVTCTDYVPPPDCGTDGESCADVHIITQCPFECLGTTVGAVSDFTVPCEGPAPDKIYQITTQATSDIHADLCGSGYDTGIAIMTGGSCPGSTVVICDDDFCGLQSSVDVFAQPAGTYWIIVTAFGGGSGPYDLHVNANPCFSACTPDSVTDLVTHLVNIDADPTANDIELYWTADPNFTTGTYDVYRSADVTLPFPGSWTQVATGLAPVQGPSANTYVDENAVPLNGARNYYAVRGVCP